MLLSLHNNVCRVKRRGPLIYNDIARIFYGNSLNLSHETTRIFFVEHLKLCGRHNISLCEGKLRCRCYDKSFLIVHYGSLGLKLKTKLFKSIQLRRRSHIARSKFQPFWHCHEFKGGLYFEKAITIFRLIPRYLLSSKYISHINRNIIDTYNSICLFCLNLGIVIRVNFNLTLRNDIPTFGQVRTPALHNYLISWFSLASRSKVYDLL